MKKFLLPVLICVLILVWTIPAIASVSSEQQRKNEIDNKIESINRQKQEIIDTKARLEKDKKELLNAQDQESKEYQQIVNDLNRIDKELEILEKSLKASEDNYNKQRELSKTRLRILYENSNYSYLKMLIESKNITDFFERLEIMSLILKKDQQMINELDEAKKDVEYKKKLVEDTRQAKASQVASARRELDRIKASRAALEDRISRNESILSRLEREEDNLVKQSEELEAQIRNMTKKGTKYTGGKMIWPSIDSKKIVSPYGYRTHPILKKKKLHTGLDIDAAYGTSTVAAGDGKVITAGWLGGYGKAIIIDHGGGITTLYAHSSKLLVSVGDKVKAGDMIAKVGSTGLSTGPHLHFEVRKDGKTTNPLDYVSP